MSTTSAVDLPHAPDDVRVDVEPGTDYEQTVTIHAHRTYLFGISIDDHRRFRAHHAATRTPGGDIIDDELPQWVHTLFANHGIHEVEE